MLPGHLEDRRRRHATHGERSDPPRGGKSGVSPTEGEGVGGLASLYMVCKEASLYIATPKLRVERWQPRWGGGGQNNVSGWLHFQRCARAFHLPRMKIFARTLGTVDVVQRRSRIDPTQRGHERSRGAIQTQSSSQKWYLTICFGPRLAAFPKNLHETTPRAGDGLSA